MVTLRVNGVPRSFDGDASTPLLWYLRDELGLTGTKFGCGLCVVWGLYRWRVRGPWPSSYGRVASALSSTGFCSTPSIARNRRSS